MPDLVLAIDQGTTGSTVLIIDTKLNVVARGYQEYRQIYPKPGWVEHDPADIWGSVEAALRMALAAPGMSAERIAAIGITNQRETSIVWNRRTGAPYHNAIVWQCRRTADICREMKEQGLEDLFARKTGLLLDPYFSGTKVRWLFENVDGLEAEAREGRVAFGTVDTFLVWRLTGGAHVTDVSNASRTLMLNLETLNWDGELQELLHVPGNILPEVLDSSHIYGHTKGLATLPDGIPVSGIAGDQQAALFGQACFEPGMAKCTYGTGSFTLMNTGAQIVHSKHRLLTTVAWRVRGETAYALEGSCFIAGAAVQWLRDGLKAIPASRDVESLAASVPDSGGVVFVPALTGLGAPHWNPDARGVIWGLNRGTTTAHIARATLEGIAWQNYEVFEAMERDFGQKMTVLRVDGGASANDLLMQFQSDILRCPISRPTNVETTAFGAAFLAGLAAGVWRDKDEVTAVWREDRRFAPSMADADVARHLDLWHEGVRRV
ncbi:MAG: glycerol kinase GlpK [Deltaproteobacteria bacterium]|nr:glycerol kinase GlpK [Deltaproteobacteria bacterium]